MSTNFVFVLDADRRPLSPCHPARARELLRRGKAAVLRRFPFTIILKRTVTDPVTEGCQVKLDPGSKTTGIAIVQGDRVIWGAEVTHRGAMIKKTLADRSARRRNRRSRLRYRKPSYRTKAQVNNAKRTYERKREQGWLAPSLRHRVDTTMTWVNRLIRFAPVGELTQELVRFDLQKMENPEVEGVQYQQGELVGFEVKEYLLVKWGRKCAYCGAENKPLEVEHPSVSLSVHLLRRSLALRFRRSIDDRLSRALACRMAGHADRRVCRVCSHLFIHARLPRHPPFGG